MPGGSVNARPFRESSDSYSRTGIPCGNPRRYQSHEVVRMETESRTRSKPIDGPLENIETEGQKQLQAMLHKQMNTHVTVQQQLGQKREFSKGADYQAASDELSGMRSLGDFMSLGDIDAYIEEMSSYGLTHEEILYKLESENAVRMTKKSKLSNPDYNVSRLREIADKISRKKQTLAKPDSFSNVKPISRHEMELENAIATANSHNKFLHNTLIKERDNKSKVNPNDPLNCIPEILENLTQTKELDYQHIHCKKKDYKKECTLECCKPATSSQCFSCDRNGNEAMQNEVEATSSHDRSCDQCHQSCDHAMEVQTCVEKLADHVPNEEFSKNKSKAGKKIPQKSTCFTVRSSTNCRGRSAKDSKMTVTEMCEKEKSSMSNTDKVKVDGTTEEIRVLDNVEAIPEEVIQQYKLSAEEVKKLPRFESYSPGKPNNVLFVKNLSPRVTEQDLASMFIQFQESDDGRIVFKLLSGRMKGQAFVTFKRTETASEALQLVHGYDFKGKPVIVQFGKKPA